MNMYTLLTVIGCQSLPDQFQVLDILDDDYALVQQSIDTLHTPKRMEGELGNLYVGGVFKTDLQTAEIEYSSGRPLHVHYSIHDGTAHPVDRDGLIAFSFYKHLEDTVNFIQQGDASLGDILPMHTAISPVISDLTLAFLPMENAAYVPTLHHFLLLTDAIPKDVPLAANKGVVAHEFGHALFHYLTTGGTTTQRFLQMDAEGYESVYSLDEGLADVLGYLVSNRPNFIADSLTDQDRALDTEHLAVDVNPLPGESDDEGFLPTYDPYSLGSVFAATVWEVDVELNDRTRIFNWLVATTKEFARQVNSQERPDGTDLGMQWLDVWVDLAESDRERQLACAAINARWTEVYEVSTCTD